MCCSEVVCDCQTAKSIEFMLSRDDSLARVLSQTIRSWCT